jgi:hypothetical protein
MGSATYGITVPGIATEAACHQLSQEMKQEYGDLRVKCFQYRATTGRDRP